MGHMVKPGDVVNFDGAVLTPEKKGLYFIKQT
jgi:23S rRNA pseudouridine2605 synthase